LTGVSEEGGGGGLESECREKTELEELDAEAAVLEEEEAVVR